jgi:hypothetical protein
VRGKRTTAMIASGGKRMKRAKVLHETIVSRGI